MNSNPHLQMIPIGSIKPNTFNPNRMSEREFAEYVAEVRHLGRLPKPTVVRPRGDGSYDIVDGEHGWRAANKIGFSEILCEVREIDEFDSMRECYKRNRGGKDNPLLLGRMFRKMLQAKKTQEKLSIRKLAEMIVVPASTINSYIGYVKAVELRGACAPDTADGDISRLSQTRMRLYRELPDSMRDAWLDGGGDLCAFDDVQGFSSSQLAYEINTIKLGKYLDGRPWHFRQSVERLAQLCRWCSRHRALEDYRDYVASVAELHLPAWVLDLLPCESDGESAAPLLKPDQWHKILKSAKPRAKQEAALEHLVAADIRVALRNAGIKPESVLGPDDAEALQILKSAPDFIRAAGHLSLNEQRALAELDVVEDEQFVMEAKRLTCEWLRLVRENASEQDQKRLLDVEPASNSVTDVFLACLEHLRGEQEAAVEDALFSNQDELLERVLEILGETRAIRGGVIRGLPAAEVLAERLDAIDWPEFYLVATGVFSGMSVEDAGRRWFEAMQREPDLDPGSE
jgi:hypothetical protein